MLLLVWSRWLVRGGAAFREEQLGRRFDFVLLCTPAATDKFISFAFYNSHLIASAPVGVDVGMSSTRPLPFSRACQKESQDFQDIFLLGFSRKSETLVPKRDA